MLTTPWKPPLGIPLSEIVEDFRMIIDNLEAYVSNTQPTLMPSMSEEYAAHQQYVRDLIRDMFLERADEELEVMKMFIFKKL